MVGLGDKVKDQITGFEGICTGRAEYLFGCVQVLVAPTAQEKATAVPESTWLDEDRVTVLAARAVARPASADIRAGGPVMTPPPVRR